MTTILALDDELLTAAQAAARLKVSTRTIWRMIRRGELEAVRLGAGWRISTNALDARLVPQRHAQRRSTTNRKV